MRSILPLLLLVLAPAPALAGWSAIQSTAREGSPSNDAKLFYDGGRFRIDSDNKSYVLEFKAYKFLFIDHGTKRYAAASLEDVIALQDKVLAQMKKQVAMLPSPQREMAQEQLDKMEKMGKKLGPPAVKKTGKKDKINGYDCEVVTWSDELGDNEACLAAKMPVDVSVFLKESSALFKRMAEKGASNATPTSALFQLPGFPVRTRRTEKGGDASVSTTEIKDVKAFKGAADTFAAPKTYTKQTLDQLVAPGMDGE